MPEISAFVAYSYDDADTSLIEIFIDHFATLASSLPEFSWDHARWAEPAPLSDKVLAKFEGKNTLIAICTRSEYALQPELVSSFIKLVRSKNLEWKTSDWIIQEIGLAIGRGMRVIVLLEDDVRKPGGLFGDVEFVSFSRTNPQASFTRMLQMLSAPPKVPVTIAPTEVRPKTSDTAKEQEEPETKGVPQADWDQARYDDAIFQAIMEKDSDTFARVDSAYKGSPLPNGVALTVWESRIEHLRMKANAKWDFEKIKKAANEHPNESDLLGFLAAGYAEFGQFETAARVYEDAAIKSEKKEMKLQCSSSAAYYFAQAGQGIRSREIIEQLKTDCSNDIDLQSSILERLDEIAVLEKDDLFELVIKERIVELRPNIVSTRFDLAYKHSQVGNNDMAFHHYLKIPRFDRTGGAWNNLGVAYDKFGMPVASINAYREAEKKGSTLAMANLGNRFLNSGFQPEAQAEGAIAESW